MDIDRKIRRISNVYYNQGLARAKNRDLTGAIDVLKKSLRFNKYHTDARNLLGLIYHEIGEVGAAMTQWIISVNLQEDNNLAEEYLKRIYRSKGYLDVADQAARKYNQALNYARNDNEDLAILQLTRMLEEYPQYVKAQELLALLYLHREEFTKAGRCLYQALKIDRYNPVCQRYMTIAKQNTGKADVEKRKLKNAFSHRQMQDDDVIMPSSYRENTGWGTVLNILAGLVMGALVSYFLIVPGMKETLSRIHNEEMRGTLETINVQNIQVSDMKKETRLAVEASERAQKELEEISTDTKRRLNQYQLVVRILSALQAGNEKDAAMMYVEINWDELNEVPEFKEIGDNVRHQMLETGYKTLEKLGDDVQNTHGDPKKALEYYSTSLMIQPDNPTATYKMGQVYQNMGDTDKANEYFGEVIMRFPDTNVARLAKEQRGY